MQNPAVTVGEKDAVKVQSVVKRMQLSRRYNPVTKEKTARPGIKEWHLNAAERTQGTKPSSMAGKKLRSPNVNLCTTEPLVELEAVHNVAL